MLESTGPGAPPTNLKEAFHWFELSAKGGYPRAQFNVARFYLNGFGVTDKNRAKAYMWLRLGAENGEAAAINLLAESKGVFSESEISEGKKLLAAYKGGQTQAKASPSPM